jgi:SHS family lactate transporter-like MFS transporter
MPLALEHWPQRLRGLASGLLQGGWYWGYILSALTFHYLYPLANAFPDPLSDVPGATLGWRVMFWVGVIPALLVLWIRSGVSESPIWLERQRRLRHDGSTAASHVSLVRLLRRDLLWTTVQTSVLMSVFMFSYYSITFWYPTFLREMGRDPLWYLVALNVGAILGMALWGQMSETRLGRRGAVTVAALAGVVSLPLFLADAGFMWLGTGALIMGATGTGVWGMAPSYLTERFPTEVRGVGPGLSYHVGAALGSTTPLMLGALQDRGWGLTGAMTMSIAISGLLVATLIWLGPETRGRTFGDLD